MGILTKEVEIKPSGKSIQYYRNLGYDAKWHEPLVVKVEDLSKGSSCMVLVQCDYCKRKPKEIPYTDYIKSVEKYGLYSCNHCVHNKTSATCFKMHGVKYYAQMDECKEKTRQTCLKKYGVEYTSQTKNMKYKSKQTLMKHYGVLNPMYSDEVKQKMTQTLLDRHGVEHALKKQEFKEKAQNTTLERFGVKNAMKSIEVQQKLAKTMYVNCSQSTSIQQRYLKFLYGGELNYPISHLFADICFPDKKLCIEYDGGGHNLCVKTKKITQEEFNKKEIIRNNIIKREGYKQMRIISSKDLLPFDSTLLQMLEHAKGYFSNYPNHSWIEFNIDTSIVRNAEYKDGVFFDYGNLRKIKKSDIVDMKCA